MKISGLHHFDNIYIKKVNKGEKSKKPQYDAAEEDEKKKQERHHKRSIVLNSYNDEDNETGQHINLLL